MLQIELSKIESAYHLRTSIALGFFDGVHLAHKKILQKTVEEAKKRNLVPAVFSFFDDEDFKNSSSRITSQDERLKLLQDVGIEVVFLSHFQKIKNTPAEVFIRDILLNKLNAGFVICGYNFRFGRKAEGSTELLAQILDVQNIPYSIESPLLYDGEAISSSRIRKLIQMGDMEKANSMLGYSFFVKGIVFTGKQIGRTIGFPTANLNFSPNQVLPSNGVYETEVILNNHKEPFLGITNVGSRPTVDGDSVNCETNLLDYSGKDFYGETIQVSFIRKIREEFKFPSLQALKDEIERNKQEVLTRHGK